MWSYVKKDNLIQGFMNNSNVWPKYINTQYKNWADQSFNIKSKKNKQVKKANINTTPLQKQINKGVSLRFSV